MRTKRLLVATIWITTAYGCIDAADDTELDTGTEVDEIGNGEVVPVGELEAVGMVSGRGSCTATLISDNLVLTAAHCVCSDVQTTQCSTAASFTLVNVRPVSNPQIRTNITWTTAETTYASHADYGIGAHLANDVAVVRINPPASQRALVTPIPISQVPPQVGETLTIVGFGGTGTGQQCTIFDGLKRKGTTTIQQVVVGAAPGDWTVHFGFPAGAYACPGDSGGPAISGDPANGTGRVVATTSSLLASKAVYGYREWIGLQGTSPGNRVNSFDLSGTAPATSNYRDVTTDPLGLLGWIDSNDIELTGDFFNRGHDQILYVNRGGSGGFLRIADYADGVSATDSLYWENYGQSGFFAGWLDSNDIRLVGDFLDRGYDQLLLNNRSGVAGRVMIVDFASGFPQVGFYSTYDSDWYMNGWDNPGDGALAGDFRGLGYDQVMWVNRTSTDGRIMINDFHDGAAPAEWVYYEAYSQGVYLNGWHDSNDLMVAGDFRGLGRDQVLWINRGPGSGRVLITDFGDGWFPAEWVYYEYYGQSTVLDSFHDSSVDVVKAGDFRGLGHDQLAMVNRNYPWFGRAQVVDFFDGWAPAEVLFYESQALGSPLLPRIDSNDIVLAGDLRGTGRPGLVTIERLEQ